GLPDRTRNAGRHPLNDALLTIFEYSLLYSNTFYSQTHYNRPMALPDSLAHLPGRHFLFVPGPTNVSDRVLRAMDRPMEDHRSSAFPELALSLFPDLRQLFQTSDGQPFVFPATGTGGWEAALVNTCSPGDRLL